MEITDESVSNLILNKVGKSSEPMAGLAGKILRTEIYTHEEVMQLAASVLSQAKEIKDLSLKVGIDKDIRL